MTISSRLTCDRKRLLHYLTADDHPERAVALQDLDAKGIFELNMDEGIAAVRIREYLARNHRSFCEEGLARFRAEFPNYSDKNNKGELTVTFQIKLENVPEHFTSGKADSGIVMDVQDAIRERLDEVMQRRLKTPTKLASVGWTDYNVTTK